MNVGLVGLGTVGRALASWLADSGFQVKAVSSRNRTSAEKFATQLGAKSLPPEQVAAASHLLFITTSDDAISEVCGNIARHGFGNCQAVFHLSGALSSLALAPAEKAGLGAASIHPLGSFTDFQQARKLLPQCWFTIEGNERGLFWAERVLTRRCQIQAAQQRKEALVSSRCSLCLQLPSEPVGCSSRNLGGPGP